LLVYWESTEGVIVLAKMIAIMSFTPFAPEAGRLLFAIRGEAGIATSLSGTSWGILATPGLVPGDLIIDQITHYKWATTGIIVD